MNKLITIEQIHSKVASVWSAMKARAQAEELVSHPELSKGPALSALRRMEIQRKKLPKKVLKATGAQWKNLKIKWQQRAGLGI